MSYIQEQVQLATQLYKQKNLIKANEILQQLLPDVAGCAHVLKLSATMQSEMGRHDNSCDLLERALAITPEDTDILCQLCTLALMAEKDLEARTYYEKAVALNPQAKALEDLHRIFTNQRMPIGQGVLVNTLPKSGSLFLWHALYTGLRLPRAKVGSDTVAVAPLVKEVVSQGAVAHAHLPASQDNLLALYQGGVTKMVLHLRDPRAALLSWVSHLDGMHQRGKSQPLHYELIDGYFEMSFEQQRLCPEYYELDFEAKLDLQIERYLPWQLNWIRNWLRIMDGPSANCVILLTHYEQLLINPSRFYRRILNFYGLPVESFKMVNDIKQEAGVDNQNGWQVYFTSAQLEKMNQQIDTSLQTRMGWV